jgi:thiosulfate/3-mercaptopyruvate sulfurtransferase
MTGAGTILLDIRPIAAYNGWSLHNEPRGGHIPGAVSFPSAWLKHENWPGLLREKEASPEKSIILYGYDPAETEAVADRLVREGYTNVRGFARFADWSADPNLPLSRLPRYDRLVCPEWVQQLLDGLRPPTHNGHDFVLCHASYRYRGDYEAGHIPGAIHLDTERLESPKDWNCRSIEELRENIPALGIRHDTTVILYGRFAHPNNEDDYPGKDAGHLAAIRCAVLLMYAGVTDVRVLNGGLESWIGEGRELTTEEGLVRPVTDFGADMPARPDYIVDTPKAKELLASDEGELVSVRSWNEFIGKVSGYNYIDKVGRIPGAVFGNCGSDAYHMENYRNVDQTMKPYHEIAAMWAKDGIVPDKHVAFYCGTGWRACDAFYHAFTMDWPRISIYDGGWLEWSSDSANPVATGLPEEVEP